MENRERLYGKIKAVEAEGSPSCGAFCGCACSCGFCISGSYDSRQTRNSRAYKSSKLVQASKE